VTLRAWRLHAAGDEFPASVRDLGERTPPVLYGLGDRELVAAIEPDRAVTIVGSRRSSAYGRGIAWELGYGAGAAGLVVVSGMALGCDSAAHEGALAAGGRTLAVLGSGPDVAYPPSRRDLYRRILESGGAVIAEQEPGTQPAPGYFPERNRIMAALAGTVVIVEGRHRSGTRHTANEAEGLGRDLGAVPGAVTSALSELPNDLLHDGAHVIRDAQDLLDLGIGVGRVAVRGVGPALDEGLRAVLAAVEGGAATCDAAALEAGVGGRDAAVALARLELAGYVEADAGGRYARTTLAMPS
jgi:DNA processing protein